MDIGVDIQKVDAFKDFDKHKKFYENIFTENEIKYCMSKADYKARFCARFCAKEAVRKAFDCTISFKDIEILNSDSGKPYIKINSIKREDVAISLSHSKDICIGMAVK